MLSEIGSNFWFSPNETICSKELGTPKQFGCGGSDFCWLSTGRSAIRLVLQTILKRDPDIKKVALIPPFTCHTVIEPFLDFGFDVHALPISIDLQTTCEEIIKKIKQTGASVLLIHRYFGFDTLPGINDAIDDIKRCNVFVIEDCTQSLYSSFEKSDADYYVGSIRKWCGVPDGGFAVSREGYLYSKPVESDFLLEQKKRRACELKYAYMFEGADTKPESKKEYREAEEILQAQKGYYKITDLSAIIQSNLDTIELSDARRRNFSFLIQHLLSVGGIKLTFGNLPDNTVPLYLPILVDDRSKLQSFLADNDIYAPVIWPKASCCPAVNISAEQLYSHLLCLPIDQRYELDDMQRIVNVINRSK